MQTKKDLITIKDLALEDIRHIFELTDKLKAVSADIGIPLTGKSMGMIFQKPSNRTRVSFEVGMTQLGGHAIYLGPDTIKLGVREKTSDIAKTLSRYLDIIVARVFAHEDILELAQCSTVPVINGLSDLFHPCQALADLYTIKEKTGGFKNKKLAFVGDGNNVVHSLLYICAKLGLDFSIATPKAYRPNEDIFKEALGFAAGTLAKTALYDNPQEAVKDADFIYTDVWTSMGREKEQAKRKKIFRGFTVDGRLVSFAGKDCKIMHCLPAHRGEEISDEVMDSINSVVFDQAENRLHVQKAILIWLLADRSRK